MKEKGQLRQPYSLLKFIIIVTNCSGFLGGFFFWLRSVLIKQTLVLTWCLPATTEIVKICQN